MDRVWDSSSCNWQYRLQRLQCGVPMCKDGRSPLLNSRSTRRDLICIGSPSSASLVSIHPISTGITLYFSIVGRSSTFPYTPNFRKVVPLPMTVAQHHEIRITKEVFHNEGQTKKSLRDEHINAHRPCVLHGTSDPPNRIGVPVVRHILRLQRPERFVHVALLPLVRHVSSPSPSSFFFASFFFFLEQLGLVQFGRLLKLASEQSRISPLQQRSLRSSLSRYRQCPTMGAKPGSRLPSTMLLTNSSAFHSSTALQESFASHQQTSLFFCAPE